MRKSGCSGAHFATGSIPPTAKTAAYSHGRLTAEHASAAALRVSRGVSRDGLHSLTISRVNGMVWDRPTKAEIDKLETFDNPGWNWDTLEPVSEPRRGEVAVRG